MRLYVIGPVTGIEDDNRPAFERARTRLESAGYTVYIPHDFIKSGTPWHKCMRISIANLLMRADAVAKIDGDYVSRGASIESATAFDCGIPVKFVSKWERLGRERQAALQC